MLTIHQAASRKHYHKKFKSKTKALRGAPFRLGQCMWIRITTPKKPHSGQRKVVKVALSTGRLVWCAISGIGHSLQKFSRVLVRGGRARDIPGVHYKMVMGKHDYRPEPEHERIRRCSKFGVRWKK